MIQETGEKKSISDIDGETLLNTEFWQPDSNTFRN